MEELSFGGVVRKKWPDITHSRPHYPTDFPTPKSKKNFSPKWRKRKESVEMSLSVSCLRSRSLKRSLKVETPWTYRRKSWH